MFIVLLLLQLCLQCLQVKGVTGAQRSSFHYDATGIYTLPKDVFNINEDRKVIVCICVHK